MFPDNNIFLNASGPKCTTQDELINLNNSQVGSIVSKSCTLLERSGNEEPRYYHNNMGSINSMGLPNLGHKFYLEMSKKISKPYFISIAGLNCDESLEIVEKVLKYIETNETKIDGLEINLSCPNIIGKGQIGYDFEVMDKYFLDCFTILKKYSKKPLIGFKLPPYFEIHHFDIVSDIMKKYPIDFITCINSIGNGLIIDFTKKKTCIRPKYGVGGIGGDYVKPTGLSNVWNFYLNFKKKNIKIKIIGCGGIKKGQDAYEYLLCGADYLQIGTQFYKEDVICFKRISEELKIILNYNKINSLEEIRGKLEVI